MPRVQVGVATSAALNRFRSSTEDNQLKVNKVDANVDALANAFNTLLANYGNTVTQVGHNTNRLAGIPNTTTVISMFNADRARIAQNEKLLFGLDNVSGTVNTRMTALEQIASVAWTSSNHGSGSGLDADKLDGVEAVGFVRYHTNALLDNSATVDALISQLSTKYGAFNDTAVTVKVSWNDGANSVLDTQDADCGLLSLSGCVIETWGSTHTPTESPVHIRITRPVPGTGDDKICVYNKQTSAVASGWRNIVLKDTWRPVSDSLTSSDSDVSASSASVKALKDELTETTVKPKTFTAVDGQTIFDYGTTIKIDMVQVFIEGIRVDDTHYNASGTRIILMPQPAFSHITILN